MNYYWQKLKTDMRKFVVTCHPCQMTKPNKKKHNLTSDTSLPPNKDFLTSTLMCGVHYRKVK